MEETADTRTSQGMFFERGEDPLIQSECVQKSEQDGVKVNEQVDQACRVCCDEARHSILN